MRSTRLAVTPKQRIFVRLDKDQGDGMISFEVFQQRRQLFELQALARIHKQCRARKVAFAGRMTWIPASSSFLAICSSVSGFEESSSSIIFLTSRFNVSSDMSPPSGPFTDSLKNERSSRTPCGVCAYLLATARLTVEGCTPTSSATSLIIMGLSASGP